MHEPREYPVAYGILYGGFNIRRLEDQCHEIVTFMCIMQTIVMISHVWYTSFGMRIILTQAWQQGYAPGQYPEVWGGLTTYHRCTVVILCNSGEEVTIVCMMDVNVIGPLRAKLFPIGCIGFNQGSTTERACTCIDIPDYMCGCGFGMRVEEDTWVQSWAVSGLVTSVSFFCVHPSFIPSLCLLCWQWC